MGYAFDLVYRITVPGCEIREAQEMFARGRWEILGLFMSVRFL